MLRAPGGQIAQRQQAGVHHRKSGSTEQFIEIGHDGEQDGSAQHGSQVPGVENRPRPPMEVRLTAFANLRLWDSINIIKLHNTLNNINIFIQSGNEKFGQESWHTLI